MARSCEESGRTKWGTVVECTKKTAPSRWPDLGEYEYYLTVTRMETVITFDEGH